MKYQSVLRAIFCFILFFAASLAHAQGLGSVNTFFGNLNTALHGIALVVTITAIMVCGFKVLFNGESIRDCKNWIIGAALIAGAAEIGALFF